MPPRSATGQEPLLLDAQTTDGHSDPAARLEEIGEEDITDEASSVDSDSNLIVARLQIRGNGNGETVFDDLADIPEIRRVATIGRMPVDGELEPRPTRLSDRASIEPIPIQTNQRAKRR